jgi:hypothetical protein
MPAMPAPVKSENAIKNERVSRSNSSMVGKPPRRNECNHKRPSYSALSLGSQPRKIEEEVHIRKDSPLQIEVQKIKAHSAKIESEHDDNSFTLLVENQISAILGSTLDFTYKLSPPVSPDSK